MTEGNIAAWKVKEGDSFSTGDVLLEIETDKATMDVEAQEDGIMAKIIQLDGAKGIQVGTRIAVLAEPGDEISSLEIPADDSKPAPRQQTKKEDPRPEPPQSSEAASSRAREASQSSPHPTPSEAGGRNTKYPLYPAVTALIHEHHISDSDIPKIPATGPNGRLLKGDVLSYLGRIQADYSSAESKRIQHLSRLDLSHTKVEGGAQKQPESKQAPPPAAIDQPPPAPAETSISLPISLSEVCKVQKRVQDTLGVSIPLSTFLARAVDMANEDLPKAKGAPPSPDELFDAVLGLNSIAKTSTGTYVPQINSALPSATLTPSAAPASSKTSRPVKKAPDIIDILTGNAAAKPKPRRGTARGPTTVGTAAAATAGAMNVFTLTVPVGEERRARTFLERVKTVLQLEPGRLLL